MQKLLIKQRPRRTIQWILPLAHQRRKEGPIRHKSFKHVLDPLVLLEVRQIYLTIRREQAGAPQRYQQVLRHGAVGSSGILGWEAKVVPEDEADLAPTQGALVCVKGGWGEWASRISGSQLDDAYIGAVQPLQSKSSLKGLSRVGLMNCFPLFPSHTHFSP